MIKNGEQFSFKLHEICNESCIFCFQEHKTRGEKKIVSFEEGIKEIYLAYKQGYRNINFTGGEPFLHKDIIKFILFAKKIGFQAIGAHSNAVKLSNKLFTEKCVKAGLNTVSVSIHHSDYDINDAIVRRKGGTKEAIEGIQALQDLGVFVIIHIVLNQLNYSKLPTIVEDFFKMNIGTIIIMFPTLQGSMENLATTAMVSYDESIQYIREALTIMDGMFGRYIYLFNIPACLVPGYEKSVMTAANGVLRELDNSTIRYFDQKQNSNAYTNGCNGCKYKSLCPGIDIPYLQYYGKESFDAIKKRNLLLHIPKSKSNVVDLLIGGNTEEKYTKLLLALKSLTSKTHLLGVSIPELGYDHISTQEGIYNIVYDLYNSYLPTINVFDISNALKFFQNYHHIEYAIDSSSKSTYKYILWFENDFRYEIIHYIFLAFKVNIERIRKILQIQGIFEGKSNPFHIGIDPLNKRIKLYIGLYHETKEISEKYIQSVCDILGTNKGIQNNSDTYQYDCIGIDITNDSLELKIYELTKKLEKIPDILGKNTLIKEVGYMKSINGRKKIFFRLEKNIKLENFKDTFFCNEIIININKDSNNKLHPKGEVKYYCKEGEKQELYFI